MKVQLFLIGVVAALSLGALSLADATPLAAHHGNGASNASPNANTEQSPEASPSPEASESPRPEPSAHPCNHGFYVSQAAHEHKGGAFTSMVAQSDLGKNGNCTAPLPTPAASGGH